METREIVSEKIRQNFNVKSSPNPLVQEIRQIIRPQSRSSRPEFTYTLPPPPPHGRPLYFEGNIVDILFDRISQLCTVEFTRKTCCFRYGFLLFEVYIVCNIFSEIMSAYIHFLNVVVYRQVLLAFPAKK